MQKPLSISLQKKPFNTTEKKSFQYHYKNLFQYHCKLFFLQYHCEKNSFNITAKTSFNITAKKIFFNITAKKTLSISLQKDLFQYHCKKTLSISLHTVEKGVGTEVCNQFQRITISIGHLRALDTPLKYVKRFNSIQSFVLISTSSLGLRDLLLKSFPFLP